MNLKLIPRYNWDYRVTELFNAYKSFLYGSQTNNLNGIFNSEPIFTTSGRASLYAILKSLSLPEHSKIGVPLYCCPVVFEIIKAAGHVPEFIDIEPDNYCISVNDLKNKIDQLKAIVVVNLFGNPVDIDAIKSVAHDMTIIEDCAQSIFSKYNGNFTGTKSDISFFSFRLGKYISSGEGSIITCKAELRENIVSIISKFENWSFIDEFIHPAICFGKSLFYHKPLFGLAGLSLGKFLDKNFNVTNKTGVNLKKISKSDKYIIANKINELLKLKEKQRQNSLFLLRNIKFPGAKLPFETSCSEYNYLFFPVRFKTKEERDFVHSYLLKSGIDTGKYLEDLREQAIGYEYKNNCPNSELCSDTVLTIPNYYTLRKSELEHIANSINNAAKHLNIHAN